MNNILSRRGFVAGSLPLSAALTAALGDATASPAPKPAAQSPGLNAPWDQMDVRELQAAMREGKLSCERLTRHYLHRIEMLDRRGPQLRSVIELNPDALAQARLLDAERHKAERGPLYGIPVLIKDNIATADRMATTAGSLALAGLHAKRDAFLVKRLREAGALILGKTNLSEWANIRSSRSTSGWSSRGGQTRHPYLLNRNPSGSSSGSAVAMAAGLCALAVGTETDGSITSPASICGVVGLKPTLGLISRDGVIPIAASQDTAGPMTRSVRDAALLLQGMAGVDARDAVTQDLPPGTALNFEAALRKDALKGARIGVIRAAMPPQPQVMALFEQALDVLREQGAVLVDKLEIPHQAKYAETELTVLMHELKAGLKDYLADFQPDAPVKTLGELIAWNRQHAGTVMPFFDQELFEQAEATDGLQSTVYQEALATNRRYSRAEGLDALFAEHQLDAIVAPTGNVAWLTDPVLGDHFTAGGFTTPFAVAGYPHITVPMGMAARLPAALSFGGLAWQDAKLLGLAHAYEQASRRRVLPAFLKE